MKLYTEEQVNFAMRYATVTTESYSEVLKLLTPIELPSDEEIKEYLKKTHTKAVNPLNVYYKTGFESGAIWMKEQILNQNK